MINEFKSRIIITYGELEAMRLCADRIPGLSMNTTSGCQSKKAAAYILELAERIKNERIASLMHD